MIEREDHGRVGVVRLAHGKANALDLELCEALAATFAELGRAGGPAAVVLTGRGSIFSAGVDLFRIVGDRGDGYTRSFLGALDRALAALLELPVPLVAAVNGHAIAGGCILTCVADRRLMALGPGRIGVPELRVGVPFPTLPLEILRGSLPPAVVRDLVLTGRTMSADDARALGLVDEVTAADELLDRALAAAESLADLPPEAFRHTKRQLWAPALDRRRADGAAWEAEALRQWSTEASRERIRAYLEATVGRSS